MTRNASQSLLLMAACMTATPVVAACPSGLYVYRAQVTSVYDGDTVTADIDLGFKMWRRGEKLRLSGINAPEIRGESRAEGLRSRDRLRELVLGKELLILTEKDKQGKYGRYLATLYLENDGKCLDVNAQLVAEGFAVAATY